MSDFSGLAEDYARVELAIDFLEKNVRRQPSLEDVAAAAGLSEFHFQRLFSRWVGISPKRFLQYLTKEHAKKLLEASENVLDAAYESGLSGPGRLHDLFVSCEAVTPGEYKSGGAGLDIAYGFHPSPFGTCLLAASPRGICGLSFLGNGKDEAVAVSALVRHWPAARLSERPDTTAPLVGRVFSLPGPREPGPLHLHVRGTNFQIQVWQALVKIPLGRAVSYEDIARHIGLEKGARAVGNAVGDNPIPFLIPCHRVLRKAGEFGNYGEGPSRKKAILGWESAIAEMAAAGGKTPYGAGAAGGGVNVL